MAKPNRVFFWSVSLPIPLLCLGCLLQEEECATGFESSEGRCFSETPQRSETLNYAWVRLDDLTPAEELDLITPEWGPGLDLLEIHLEPGGLSINTIVSWEPLKGLEPTMLPSSWLQEAERRPYSMLGGQLSFSFEREIQVGDLLKIEEDERDGGELYSLSVCALGRPCSSLGVGVGSMTFEVF